MTTMNEQSKKGVPYVAPDVECMEVAVEAGFEGSVEGAVNEGYEQEDGEWD